MWMLWTLRQKLIVMMWLSVHMTTSRVVVCLVSLIVDSPHSMKSNIQIWMLTFSCHAKTVSHITQVDLHSTSATQQLDDCTGFHIRITYIVSQKSIPLDVWQWLWQMWTNFQNFFTRWFVGKFSTYVYKDFHLTCNNLLHYLVKWNSKIQKSRQIFTLNMTINMIN